MFRILLHRAVRLRPRSLRERIFFLIAQVKLDVDVSMTPEMEVTSTVASGNSNNSSDSDQSNEIPMGATLSTVSLNPPTIENQFKVSGVKIALDSCARVH